MDANHPQTPRVVVIGQGYVGLPLAIAAVDAGFDVVGYDVDINRTKALADGRSFTVDVPSAKVRAALDCGRYVATDDQAALENFDVAIITVPTPLNDGDPDLSFVVTAAKAIADYVRPGSLVVLESTTYPGTTEELVVPLLESGSGLRAGTDFMVGYSPERIDPGNPTWTFANTPKLCSGIDAASLAAVCEFYGAITEKVIPVDGTRQAELAKLIENTFRHVNVALVNELAVFAGELGVDVWGAIDAAATKPFGFMRFTPGPGVGGHCLPIDPSYLSWMVRRRTGRPFRFVELANNVNDQMPRYVADRVAKSLNRAGIAVSRSRILLLGLAYKRNTSDARESPAMAVAQLLAADGAELLIADPHVGLEMFERVGGRRVVTDMATVTDADLVVLLTDHDSFDYEFIVRHAQAVLDTRHRMEGPNVEYL